MLYDLELSQNAAEDTKNICCAKDGVAVDHSTVTWWLKNFCMGCRKLDPQAKGQVGLEVETTLKAIEANQVSRNRRISGELGISLSNVVRYFHDLNKLISN